MSSGNRVITALTSLNISNIQLLTAEVGNILADMLKVNSSLKELDVSKNIIPRYSNSRGVADANDSPGFAKELADGLKNNGEKVSANLLNNTIGTEHAYNLAVILEGHATLKSLCGNRW